MTLGIAYITPLDTKSLGSDLVTYRVKFPRKYAAVDLLRITIFRYPPIIDWTPQRVYVLVFATLTFQSKHLEIVPSRQRAI